MMSLLDLLTAGKVEEFNATRGQRSAPELFAADLANCRLAGADLSGANLEKADLSGADLTGAILAKANLSGADLTGTVLVDVVAIRSRWRDAWLEEANLDGGDFSAADFTDAVLNGASARDATFTNARLRRVEAKEALFDRSDLSEAKLGDAQFPGAHFPSCRLIEAKLGGTDFSGAHLDRADLQKARATGVKLVAAVLRGAKLGEADLTEADLSGADLSGADLVRADLAAAVIADAIVSGADFSEARLDPATRAALAEAGAKLEGDSASPIDPRPADFVFEDVSGAVAGGSLGVLWENCEPEGRVATRAAVCQVGGEFSGLAPALPTPADLTVAQAILPLAGGFLAAALAERPGGFVLELTDVSFLGDMGATRTLRMEYRPAVRPVFVAEDGTCSIYGLGRDGPTLWIHRWTGEDLERVFAARVTNARGFVGARQPALVTKGGVLRPLGAGGLGAPRMAPDGFPGRLAGAASIGDRMWLAWTPRGENGFRWSEIGTTGRPEIHRACPKTGMLALDLAVLGDRPLAIYAREGLGENGLGPAVLEGRFLGAPRPFHIDVGGVDVEEVRVIGVTGHTLHLLATTIEEDLLLVQVDAEPGRGEVSTIRCQLP